MSNSSIVLPVTNTQESDDKSQKHETETNTQKLPVTTQDKAQLTSGQMDRDWQEEIKEGLGQAVKGKSPQARATLPQLLTYCMELFDGAFERQALEKSGLTWNVMCGLYLRNPDANAIIKTCQDRGRAKRYHELEEAAYKRAKDGVQRPTRYGPVVEYETRLTELLLLAGARDAGEASRFQTDKGESGGNVQIVLDYRKD